MIIPGTQFLKRHENAVMTVLWLNVFCTVVCQPLRRTGILLYRFFVLFSSYREQSYHIDLCDMTSGKAVKQRYKDRPLRGLSPWLPSVALGT